MKLIDDQAADFLQIGIFQQQSQEDAFSHVKQSRGGAADVFKTHLVANFIADAAPAFFGHSLSQHARSDAPRLQHIHALTWREHAAIEHELRHLR